MEERSLVGRIIVTEHCETDFVPASTSVKYKCELVGTFSSLRVVNAINDGAYVVINKWVWLTASTVPTIAIDAGSVGLTPASDVNHEKSITNFQSTSTISFTGQVRAISAFLRIKDYSDPFNHSFCVHFEDGNTAIFRGQKLFLFRQVLEPGTIVDLVNFRKIKLKSFNNAIVFMSVDDSSVSRVEKLDRSLIRSAVADPLTSGLKVRGRVFAIDPPHVWITPLSDAGPKRNLVLVMNRWGVCDKRKISLGAIVRVHTFHYVHGVVGFCPSRTILTVEELPPIATPVSIHSLCGQPSLRCLLHNLDAKSECHAREPNKFGINILCGCDCETQCDAVNDSLLKTLTQLTQPEEKENMSKRTAPVRDLSPLFRTAFQASEVCVSLLRLSDALALRAPPFFNVSFECPLRISVSGPPAPEATKFLRAFPSAVYFSIFPRTRPINSFVSATLRHTTDDEPEVTMQLLVPRDAVINPETFYSIQQLLVVSCSLSDPVQAVLLTDQNFLRIPDTRQDTCIEPLTATVRTKLSRRNLLRNKIWESHV